MEIACIFTLFWHNPPPFPCGVIFYNYLAPFTRYIIITVLRKYQWLICGLQETPHGGHRVLWDIIPLVLCVQEVWAFWYIGLCIWYSYVFLYCRIHILSCILAMVYIPPPFVATMLQQVIFCLFNKPDIPPLLIGDFNGYLCPQMINIFLLLQIPSIKEVLYPDISVRSDGFIFGEIDIHMNQFSLFSFPLCL